MSTEQSETIGSGTSSTSMSKIVSSLPKAHGNNGFANSLRLHEAVDKEGNLHCPPLDNIGVLLSSFECDCLSNRFAFMYAFKHFCQEDNFSYFKEAINNNIVQQNVQMEQLGRTATTNRDGLYCKAQHADPVHSARPIPPSPFAPQRLLTTEEKINWLSEVHAATRNIRNITSNRRNRISGNDGATESNVDEENEDANDGDDNL